MYGMVINSIESFIIDRYGQQTWEAITESCNLDDSFFISTQPYDDEITYRLVGASCQILELSSEKLLFELGQHWIDFALQTPLGKFLNFKEGGFLELLTDLDQMHSRIKMVYPELNPPRFSVLKTETLDKSGIIELRYTSHRAGLLPFLYGLLHRIAKEYCLDLEISTKNDAENDHSSILELHYSV